MRNNSNIIFLCDVYKRFYSKSLTENIHGLVRDIQKIEREDWAIKVHLIIIKSFIHVRLARAYVTIVYRGRARSCVRDVSPHLHTLNVKIQKDFFLYSLEVTFPILLTRSLRDHFWKSFSQFSLLEARFDFFTARMIRPDKPHKEPTPVEIWT